MYKLQITKQFEKDFKILKKRGFELGLLKEIINTLLKGKQLDQKFKDHSLTGNYSNYRECYIKPNWLLIYRIEKDKLILTASRTGSHSDLF